MNILKMSWSGMGTVVTLESRVGTPREAELQIKDGGIRMVIADCNNDGTISDDDYATRQDAVGSLLVKGSTDTC